jgi:hypothetical protein
LTQKAADCVRSPRLSKVNAKCARENISVLSA